MWLKQYSTYPARAKPFGGTPAPPKNKTKKTTLRKTEV
jgi:hypothetical protein